jgi:alkylation response protein AidB-like acyl-CoA dehydrogenase
MLDTTNSDTELEMIRTTARRFFADEVEPYYLAWEKQGHVDRDVWRKAGALGLLCPMMKEEDGGLGGDKRCRAAIARFLDSTCIRTSWCLTSNGSEQPSRKCAGYLPAKLAR